MFPRPSPRGKCNLKTLKLGLEENRPMTRTRLKGQAAKQVTWVSSSISVKSSPDLTLNSWTVLELVITHVSSLINVQWRRRESESERPKVQTVFPVSASNTKMSSVVPITRNCSIGEKATTLSSGYLLMPSFPQTTVLPSKSWRESEQGPGNWVASRDLWVNSWHLLLQVRTSPCKS